MPTAMLFAAEAEVDVWRWQAHPEVWVLIAGAVMLAWYAVKVVGPNALRNQPGVPVVTRRNVVAYVCGILALWVASDWPLHDISEEYLYSAHMVQHLIISMIVPPLLLVAMPEWLARLIINSDGRVGSLTRRMTHPVMAGFVFNFVVAMTHLTVVVNFSVENGVFHYFVHLVVFITSLWMWTPVIAPLQEVRLSPQGQIVYLFLMSIIPTVPAGFLTFAEGTLYDAYDHTVRLWGIGVTTDQQAAGLIMKLVGGFYLWGWIVVRFADFVRSDRRNEPPPIVGSGDGDRGPDGSDDIDLTFEDVQREFEASTAPVE